MPDELDQRVRELQAERARREIPQTRTEIESDLQRVIHLLASLFNTPPDVTR